MKTFFNKFVTAYPLIVKFSYFIWIIFGCIHVIEEWRLINNEIWWLGFTSLWFLAGVLPFFIVFIFNCIVYILFDVPTLMKVKLNIMFDRFSADPSIKKFAGLTCRLSLEQFVNLKLFFKTMNINMESAVNFLESCRGIAFLEEYSKSNSKLKPSQISQMIIETERNEQILSFAHDILKDY